MGSLATGRQCRVVVPAIFLISALAALAGWALLRYGIRMTPDSWAYWATSVNLLHGRGYCHFDGRPLRAWPPGYPLYLAGWEYFAGVSGRSLAMANLLLVALAAGAWTSAFFLPFKSELERAAAQRPRSLMLPLLVAAFIAATIVSCFHFALAHNLVYVFYPLVLYATHRMVRAQREGRAGVGFALLNIALLSFVLISHNSFFPLPLLVGVLLAFYPGSKTKIAIRWTLAGLITVVPMAVWVVTRWYLGQLQSHTTHDKPKYSWTDYAHQTFTGIAKLFGPMVSDRESTFTRIGYYAGAILLAVTCVILFVSLIRLRKSSDSAGHAMVTYVVLALGLMVAEYVEFNKTFVEDPLYFPRFVMFIPMTLFPAMVMLCWQHRLHASDSGAGVILHALTFATACAVCVSAVAVAARYIYQTKDNAGRVDVARAGNDTMFAYNRMTLDYNSAFAPPKEEGGMVVVSPEDHREWLPAKLKN